MSFRWGRAKAAPVLTQRRKRCFPRSAKTLPPTGPQRRDTRRITRNLRTPPDPLAEYEKTYVRPARVQSLPITAHRTPDGRAAPGRTPRKPDFPYVSLPGGDLRRSIVGIITLTVVRATAERPLRRFEQLSPAGRLDSRIFISSPAGRSLPGPLPRKSSQVIPPSIAPTIVHQFVHRVEQDRRRTAMHIKREGQYRAICWGTLAEDVRRVARGLASLGIGAGDHVAQLSENRYEWIVTDLAIQSIQAIHVPLHASLAAEQIQQQLCHSDSRVLLISDDRQLAKLRRVEQSLPVDLRCVRFSGAIPTLGHRPIIAFSDWLAPGPAEANATDITTRALQELTGDSPATILYTSGTTGPPKGVMLSHANLLFAAGSTIRVKQLNRDDVRLSFLPWSHIYERACGLYTAICAGTELALAESRETIVEDCAAITPTVINGVPYFYQQLRCQLEQSGRTNQPDALRTLLGGRIRSCSTGGAPLPDSLYDFYHERGVPLLQGYGLTEASPVIATSGVEEHRRGTVGRPLNGTEVRIADDGEILTRGPHVMLAYWRDAAATAETLRDGWLHTGDLGQIDTDGFLRITGRKSEKIVLTIGKKVAPAFLESLLTADPLIAQAMIVGDGRNYLTALIVPHQVRLWETVGRHVAPADDPTILERPEIRDLMQRRIDACLSNVSDHEQVRRFALLDRPFAMEQGELTPKLSLRRPVILEHFADVIDAMYEPV